MESFYLLIPVTIIFCIVAVALFFWAVQRHQFDDLESQGRQILFDDDPVHPEQRDDQPGDSPANQSSNGSGGRRAE